ncbi:MAG: glucosaminidase domain-containing protein [Paraclostridium sp.]
MFENNSIYNSKITLVKECFIFLIGVVVILLVFSSKNITEYNYTGDNMSLYLITEEVAKKYNIPIEEMELIEDRNVFVEARPIEIIIEDETTVEIETPSKEEILTELLPSDRYGHLADYLPIMERVATDHGVNLVAMVAQFKIESSYGRRTPKHKDGTPTYNFFGLTASKKYRDSGGSYVSNNTTEYKKDGTKYTTSRYFRSYENPEAAIIDYATILKKYYNGGYEINEFKKYASDPKYLSKLTHEKKLTTILLDDVFANL